MGTLRPMIKFIKDNHNDGELIGAEIGVKYGDNAYNMLSTLPIKHLSLVDPYHPYRDINGQICNVFDNPLKKAKKQLKVFGDKYSFIVTTSEDASKMFPDFYFDFIYIDARHDKKHIKQDIELWYPKVKVSGILGGHDFDMYHGGVMDAVLEFVDENNIEPISLPSLEDDEKDWWIIKNKLNTSGLNHEKRNFRIYCNYWVVYCD